MTIQTGLFADNHFYRTIPMDSPQEAITAESGAKSKDEQILRYMQETGKELTAWDLAAVFPNFLIGSIRRGLFNLEMKSCRIEQTGWVKGPKGVNVGKYKAL